MKIRVRRAGLAILVLSVILVSVNTVKAAGGGHLWFYSEEPFQGLDGKLPDITSDPNYQGPDPDPWLSESIVIPLVNGPTSIWLACAQFESTDTKVVVSINEAAHQGLAGITVNVGGNSYPISSWVEDPTGLTKPEGPLAGHGVLNSDEFFGYYEVPVGYLDSQDPPGPYKVEIEVVITLGPDPPGDMKIHFDAYGTTATGRLIFSPYSHDSTFLIPEGNTILLLAASFSALALYMLKRNRISVRASSIVRPGA